jgi:DNA polymerase-3 subunit alpha
MVLLAKNFKGYKNLAKLSSLGFTNGFYAGVPRISKKQIAEFKEDLIAVTSGIYGDVPNAILNFGEQKGEEVFLWWKEQFGDDFYVQIQNHDLPDEEHLNEVLLDLADKHDVKILAQNETFYTKKEDAKIQDIITCIKDGERVSTPIGKGFGKRKGLANDHYYVQNPEELKQTFRQFPDAFEAYQNFYKNLNLIL